VELTGLLASGRAAAEALMQDACVITAAGTGTTDDLTGEVTGGTTTIYTGKCKVQQSGRGSQGQRTDSGQLSTILLRLEVHVPVAGTEAVTRGAVVTITAAANDSALVGRTFAVHDLSFKSFATARRLGVEEVT
jgi:hypothetical protein